MFQWLNHPFGSIKINHFFPKSNKNEIKIFHICDFLEGRKTTIKPSAVVWSERETRWWLAGVPVAWCGLWTTWGSLTPSPLPSQHPYKAIVCLQIKELEDVWQLWRIGRCNRCTGTSPPLLGSSLGQATSAMEPWHKKKQRIPFDVNHNFVLPTKMKINLVFGGGGRKARRQGTNEKN